MEFDIDAANAQHLEGLRQQQAKDAAAPPIPIGYSAAAELELWQILCRREIDIYERWLAEVAPDMQGTIRLVGEMGTWGTIEDVYAVRKDTLAATVAILRETFDGNFYEAYVALDRPLPLSREAKVVSDKWAPYEWDGWFFREANGLSHGSNGTDGRAKAVVEPASGMTWGSVVEVAMAVGRPVSSIYQHLRKRPGYATINGRVFEYDTTPKTAERRGVLDMTEGEKEESRARTRAAGFEPRF